MLASEAPAGEPIGSAVVLALPVAGAAPLDELAGLPLVLRAVLTLQKEGVARVVLVVADGDAVTGARVAGDRRTRVEVRVIEASSAARLRAQVDGPCLLARHDVVLDPSIYRDLRSISPAGATAVVATCAGVPVGPAVITPALVGALPSASQHALLAEALLCPATWAGVRALDVGARWHADVSAPEGRRRAFRELFEACRKPVDGVVARHLNRHISIFISKRLVGLPVTPNMLSVFTFLLGVAGAYACSFGGYSPMLLGAFLFQWNSILDGVDGELARVRFQHSKVGQWLDTVSDDLSNVVFYAGVAVGAAPLRFGHELAICAWIGILASLGATAQYYVEMARVGSGDLYVIDWGFDKAPPPGLWGKLLLFFRNVLKKDFAILFFLGLAVLGVLPYALPIVAGSAVGTFIAATLRNVSRRRGRAHARA